MIMFLSRDHVQWHHNSAAPPKGIQRCCGNLCWSIQGHAHLSCCWYNQSLFSLNELISFLFFLYFYWFFFSGCIKRWKCISEDIFFLGSVICLLDSCWCEKVLKWCLRVQEQKEPIFFLFFLGYWELSWLTEFGQTQWFCCLSCSFWVFWIIHCYKSFNQI